LQVELTEATLHVIAALVYTDWSEAFDWRTQVAKEVDDGSPDWQQFHRARGQGADAEFADATVVLNEIQAIMRPIHKRMLADA